MAGGRRIAGSVQRVPDGQLFPHHGCTNLGWTLLSTTVLFASAVPLIVVENARRVARVHRRSDFPPVRRESPRVRDQLHLPARRPHTGVGHITLRCCRQVPRRGEQICRHGTLHKQTSAGAKVLVVRLGAGDLRLLRAPVSQCHVSMSLTASSLRCNVGLRSNDATAFSRQRWSLATCPPTLVQPQGGTGRN